MKMAHEIAVAVIGLLLVIGLRLLVEKRRNNFFEEHKPRKCRGHICPLPYPKRAKE
jgi:hypothetical protein